MKEHCSAGLKIVRVANCFDCGRIAISLKQQIRRTGIKNLQFREIKYLE